MPLELSRTINIRNIGLITNNIMIDKLKYDDIDNDIECDYQIIIQYILKMKFQILS